MKIFLDPQIFYLQKFGGISRIYAEFWSICKERKDVEIVCPLFYSDNLHLREKNLFPKRLTFLFDKNYPGKKYVNAILKRVNKKYINYHLNKNDYDVFVASYYVPYFMDKLQGKPCIATVFDMIHEIFPAYFTKEEEIMANKKLVCEKSDKIVAISASTKKDILKFYPTIKEDKVRVIYLSQSIDTKEVNTLGILPSKYVLFIGKRGLYKQFDTLLKAMLPVFEQDRDIKILCAGGGKLSGAEQQQLTDLKLQDRIVQYNFNDNELFSIYQKAALFVFPSEYEGFGIPALESMVCGCPVILSNTSSLPEIAEDAALYFEPNDVIGLTTAIKEILYNDAVRESLVAKGYEQAKKFSWKKMTEEYLETAREILK